MGGHRGHVPGGAGLGRGRRRRPLPKTTIKTALLIYYIGNGARVVAHNNVMGAIIVAPYNAMGAVVAPSNMPWASLSPLIILWAPLSPLVMPWAPLSPLVMPCGRCYCRPYNTMCSVVAPYNTKGAVVAPYNTMGAVVAPLIIPWAPLLSPLVMPFGRCYCRCL